MSRRRPEPGIRIICTDARHQAAGEFAQRGFHVLYEMELLPMAAGGFTLNRKGISAAAIAPAKPVVRADGQYLYWFECTCPRDVQRLESKLVDHVLALIAAAGAADPLTARVDLDITTI